MSTPRLRYVDTTTSLNSSKPSEVSTGYVFKSSRRTSSRATQGWFFAMNTPSGTAPTGTQSTEGCDTAPRVRSASNLPTCSPFRPLPLGASDTVTLALVIRCAIAAMRRHV